LRTSRKAYRALLDLESQTRNLLLLLEGRTPSDVHSNPTVETAVRRQIRSIVTTARRQRRIDGSLLDEYQDDVERLDSEALDLDMARIIARRFHAGIMSQIRNVKPRWTTLGLRHRRRRQLGRIGETDVRGDGTGNPGAD
jgi:hypothetical protein